MKATKPDTETLDKLYLEWSQFTSARTARELAFIALADEMRLRMNSEEKYRSVEYWEARLREIAEGGGS